MYEAVVVQVRQRAEYLDEGVSDLGLARGAAQDVGIIDDQVGAVDVDVQVNAVDELHGVEVAAFFGVQVVERDEVPVAQARDGAKLTLKVVECSRIRELEDLERDVAPAHRVEDGEDIAHAAPAEGVLDLVATGAGCAIRERAVHGSVFSIGGAEEGS